uniref:Integrase catalytic domain-containing protein n=1 Tax=Cacopsylla melanoneura TaxID=428564 RepID=A0A8D8Y2Z5_9HEMI
MHVVHNEPESNVLITMSERISSWNKLIRVTALVLKFGGILKKGPISVQDMEIAEARLLRHLQESTFKSTIDELKENKECTVNSLKRLRPFLQDNLLRCGGRLTNAVQLEYQHVHPVILPKKHHIVNLLIDHTHTKNFHCGSHLVTAVLRKKYWILGCRDIVRNRTRKCNRCFKVKPKPIYPMMSNLPSSRVQEAPAFQNTGVDYAGPFLVTISRRRGFKSQKAYLCLFVCLTTKALHLELASDLSTPTFLNALKRFIGRRGTVKNIYCDQGSNFIGAANALGELYTFLSTKEFKDSYTQELLENRIQFHFNPPAAPHFGGIWESAVKGVKTHLYRTIGSQILTYEELNTVFIGIESILNSRPLCQLSSDPSDPVALTPAHFLMQCPTKHIPSMNDEVHMKLGERYKLIQQLLSNFWKRWTNEYLSSLQERTKWMKDAPIKLQVGMLVLIKSENTPVLSWLLGRIIEVFKSSSDGVARVALVKTSHGVYKRPAVKLCPLPSQ